eukprot:593822_1
MSSLIMYMTSQRSLRSTPLLSMNQIRRFCAMQAPQKSDIKRTALYDFHLENGGKMVDFSGWSLPIQYSEGIGASVLHTRHKASLFDVSHMGQLRFYGADRQKFIESMVVSSLKALKDDQSKYTLITNKHAGIIDDTVVTRRADHMGMVINAGRVTEDLIHIEANLKDFCSNGGDVSMEFMREHSLIALQGPKAAEVLQHLAPSLDVASILFFRSVNLKLAGCGDCVVTRCGYTGEDGFEISVASDQATRLARELLSHSEVRPAGLGARDVLRLEAGLCLYGHDLNESISPVEADLMFTIGKKRLKSGKVPGADEIRKQVAEGTAHKRVGLLVDGAPAREGAEIEDLSGAPIGRVTSGTFSPCRKKTDRDGIHRHGTCSSWRARPDFGTKTQVAGTNRGNAVCSDALLSFEINNDSSI